MSGNLKYPLVTKSVTSNGQPYVKVYGKEAQTIVNIEQNNLSPFEKAVLSSMQELKDDISEVKKKVDMLCNDDRKSGGILKGIDSKVQLISSFMAKSENQPFMDTLEKVEKIKLLLPFSDTKALEKHLLEPETRSHM